MLDQLKAYILKEKLLATSQRILLAASGGLDSTVLAHLLVRAGYEIAIAHAHFGLRGEESDRDAQFTASLASALKVPFYIKYFDTEAYAATHQCSIQVAARELRYAWLESLRQEQELDLIATAHHMQDNVETVWMNLSKGTGIAGLHGILPKQDKLIRPLLFAARKEIAAFAAAEQITFVEDSSNLTDKYTRNYFRHQVLPAIEQAFPEAVKNTAASIERFREAEILYQQALDVHRKKLLEQRGQEYFIPVLKLQKTQPLQTILYELLKPFGCSPAQSAQVAALLDSGSGHWVATQTHRILRDRKWLIITPLEVTGSRHFIIEEDQHMISLPDASISMDIIRATSPLPSDPHIACVNIDVLQFPLLLRKWKQGDYFYPLGMTRKKKLSRFFIDQKLSLADKEKVWVLESAKKIVWVVGMRIDNRFRVTDQTKEVLRLHWH